MNQRWIVVLAMLLLAVGVGVVAFNAGVQHGVVEAGRDGAVVASILVVGFGVEVALLVSRVAWHL